MPSHATMRNSSPASRLNVWTSGVEQMICSLGCKWGFFLYSRSPIDRDRFRLPFTRYWTMGPTCCRSMEPPAFAIRLRSVGRFGLWSSDSGTAWRLLESTARLSPAFATTITSGRTRQTTHVQPTQSGFAAIECKFSWGSSSPSISSMRWKAAMSAHRLSLLRPLPISPGRCRSQNCATSLPPCPSMTPKAAVSVQPSPSRFAVAKCASSIWTRQPCMQL
mmetsp:Transcript_127101/g.359739  ORF Transcript_127101/g.359739 Transcript_127101/m.359739 type:complete len:220 (-) Transcript_127101:207-866(-)